MTERPATPSIGSESAAWVMTGRSWLNAGAATGPPSNGDRHLPAALDPREHAGGVVPELSRRDVRHDATK
jgi:hypothetical protein